MSKKKPKPYKFAGPAKRVLLVPEQHADVLAMVNEYASLMDWTPTYSAASALLEVLPAMIAKAKKRVNDKEVSTA